MATPYPSPPGPPALPSPDAVSRQDIFQSSSPPTTPQTRHGRARQLHTGSRRRAARHDIALDRVTSVDEDGLSGVGSTEDKDPHDLAFSPKHVTRASVVDNMVMALDQFSNPGSNTASASRLHHSAHLRSTSSNLRRRGDTYSSEVSLENESRLDEDFALRSLPNRQNSSNYNPQSAFPRSLYPIQSLYEEEESIIGHRVYESQRARPSRLRLDGTRSSRSSYSSSFDLDHALTKDDLNWPNNRPSRSFDLGSNRPQFPLPPEDVGLSDTYDMLDQFEAAPTPIVHAGPSRGHSPIRKNSSAPLTPTFDQNFLEGNHLAKSNAHGGRKSRTGAKGVVNTKGRVEPRDFHGHSEEYPTMPPFVPPPRQSQMPTSSGNPSPPSRVDMPSLTQPARDRPGFLRRVFGSKNASAMTFPLPELEDKPSREPMPRLPTEEDAFRAGALLARPQKQSTPGENLAVVAAPQKEPQTLSKKSSAFFRRRKKSISELTSAPVPLSHRSVKAEALEPSPINSLRQGMDSSLASPSLPFPPIEPIHSSDIPPDFHAAQMSLPQRHDLSIDTNENTHILFNHPEHTPVSDPAIPRSGRPSDAEVTQRHDVENNRDINTSALADNGEAEPPHTKLTAQSPSKLPGLRSPPHGLGSDETVSPGATQVSISSTSSARPSILRLQRQVSDHVRYDSTSKDYLGSAATVSASPSVLVTPDEEASGILSPSINITQSPARIGHQRTYEEDREQALKIFENRDESLDPNEASSWLGDAGDARERVRMAYMSLFDWTNVDILSALRGLCVRIALRGETQQVDRMLEAFSKQWCECNPNHGFRSSDVVHTICYSILLLNTDLHLAEIVQRMTRSQFIRNTLPTIKRIAFDTVVEESSIPRVGTWPRLERASSDHPPPLPQSPISPMESPLRRSSLDEARSPIASLRSPEKTIREAHGDVDYASSQDPGPLVASPHVGSQRAWECRIEQVLKQAYTSISRERLPLFGAMAVTPEATQASGNLLSITGNLLRRSPSTLSKATSDHSRGRGPENRLGAGRWASSKPRSRSTLHSTSNHGSTRTSMDEGSSAWSPSVSSTWSRVSGGKTLTSMSVDSLGPQSTRQEFQKSIGFANALSQAIIREESSSVPSSDDVGIKVAPLLDDESLELSGAPWAKEGSLKHKHHLDGVNKRAKGRNWNDCFAVIQRGWMRLFSFTVNAKSLRIKAKERAKTGGVIGGGNWMDNAEEVCKFLLHHAIASALPEPGYSETRPYVWALSLPTGAVHLFQVGTADLVQEFVSTANYWSARFSKEPMLGGISNMEYGWSDQVINRALVSSESQPNVPTGNARRPSLQSSVRSSLDHRGGGLRPKLPGDKVLITEWCPPQQSMTASQLMEVDQLRTLQTYVENVEVELARHNELRPAMQLAFSPRHTNTTRAMANWEKKSSYLLREIVKFQTYLDSLLLAQSEKEKVLKAKAESGKES